MPNGEENKINNELEGLKLTSLRFEYDSWDKKGWTASARLSERDGSSGVKDIEIQLDDSIASKLIVLLAPIIVEHASNSAQKLADQAKKLVTELGEKIQQAVEDKKE